MKRIRALLPCVGVLLVVGLTSCELLDDWDGCSWIKGHDGRNLTVCPGKYYVYVEAVSSCGNGGSCKVYVNGQEKLRRTFGCWYDGVFVGGTELKIQTTCGHLTYGSQILVLADYDQYGKAHYKWLPFNQGRDEKNYGWYWIRLPKR